MIKEFKTNFQSNSATLKNKKIFSETYTKQKKFLKKSFEKAAIGSDMPFRVPSPF